MKKIKVIINIVLLLTIFWPIGSFSQQSAIQPYPRLANYFLKWTIEDYEVEELARWDLLVLDMEVSENSRANVEKIRELNPDIKILAYITSQEIIGDIYQNEWQFYGNLRKRLVDNIDDSWWLRDKAGNRISFWPGTYMLNMTSGCGSSPSGDKWNEYLPTFIKSEIYDSGLWDGVFYDNLWGDVTWAKDGNIDINRDGNIRSIAEINSAWASGNKEMLVRSRELMGNNFIIIGNGLVYDGYQPYLNGMMFESFPSPWENGGTWSGSMNTYAKISAKNRQPNISILNTYNKDRNNFAKVRFGLASTLMQDSGYFSYDYDNTNHGQLWWYDEYDVNLGKPLFPAYNILDKTDEKFKPGLWRRDFENGIAMLNSTGKEQKYIFSREEFEKINGGQDPSVNNGQIINWVKIAPNDGVILLKRNTEIINNSFFNGNFIRVYNDQGAQVRNGFFSYLDNFPGNEQIIVMDLDSDQEKEYLANGNGVLSLYKNGKKIKVFNPYKSKFKGEISTALADLDNNGKYEIIAGAGKGGGPQIQIMSSDGALIGTFFAYSKSFRGGVNVAGGNIGGDAKKEIITGPGAGMEPEVRVYGSNGKLYSKFLAYDKKFRGGVNVAVGDVNGDGVNEIVTGAGAGGGPEIRVFDIYGKLLKKFMAYDKSIRTGVRVIVEDMNDDGVDEILASSANF
ncbi:MAG: putative glycoside hydrolase [Patescibacteria group bacterium]